MELITYNFQAEAEDELYEQITERLESDDKSIDENKILFLSCVASGKTKMTSSVCNRLAGEYDDVAFFFFSPSSAQLHNNAYSEIKAYGWDKLDVLTLQDMVVKSATNGNNVPVGSFTTIGWSDINKSDKNVQMKKGEQATFLSVMENNKTKIVCLYDEGHLNQDRQKIIKELVRPYAEILITATSKKNDLKKAKENMRVVQVDTQKVIDEGKIKSQIIVNDCGMDEVDTEAGLNGDASWKGLIAAGWHRRGWLEERYKNISVDTIPIMVIQLPNDDTSDKKDTLQTVKNKDIVKEILMELGVAKDEIIVWLAGQHDIDPNDIKNTKHKVLIVKVACATGWNCPRAMPLVKLREPSQSDTLDEQTMGRFMRTVDPVEWLVNEAYQTDEYLNTAFVYTASEEYDASLKGYSIRDEAYVQTMRDKYKDQWKKVHLVKITPGTKYLDAADKIIKDMVAKFNANFPMEYKTNGGNWVYDDTIERRVAAEKEEFANIMKNIGDTGKSITSGHDYVDLENEKVEDYIWAKIKKEGSIKKHRELISNAINKHLDDNLCYNLSSGTSFLSTPEKDELEQRMTKRNDFFKGIYKHFDLFVAACKEAIDAHVEYHDDVVWDGPENSAHKMYVPPTETFTSISLETTSDSSNFAFDKQATSGASKPEQSMIAEFMNSSMDTWFKNGTHDKDSFLIAYEDNDGAHCKFFPDFLAIKGKTLFVIETKGAVDGAGDHSIEKDKDKAKSKAVYAWNNKYKQKSIDASDNIDNIVFAIAKKINGDWKIYQGNGNNYEEFNGEDWILFRDIVNKA